MKGRLGSINRNRLKAMPVQDQPFTVPGSPFRRLASRCADPGPSAGGAQPIDQVAMSGVPKGVDFPAIVLAIDAE